MLCHSMKLTTRIEVLSLGLVFLSYYLINTVKDDQCLWISCVTLTQEFTFLCNCYRYEWSLMCNATQLATNLNDPPPQKNPVNIWLCKNNDSPTNTMNPQNLRSFTVRVTFIRTPFLFLLIACLSAAIG